MDINFSPYILNRLRGRFKDALILRFGLEGYKEHTYREIGNIFGCSIERVRQLVQRGLQLYKREMVAYKKEVRVFRFYYFLFCSETYSRILLFIEDLVKISGEQKIVKQLPIEVLELSTRSLNCIRRYTNAKTVEDLENLFFADRAIPIKNLGAKSISEIQNALNIALGKN